uniref:G-protein coupled receptors family 1 profile domain-containing protein n=1 Tax=Plectus sambesii TaxID=2011161 RepID=A0A914VLP2_9BILA
MTVTDIVSTIASAVMFFTIPVYFLYLLMLYKNRNDENLKYPFYKLMFSVGIADLLQIINLLLGNTLANSGIFPELYIFLGGLAARISNFGLFGFGMAQNIGMLFVAFNRYTAYILPMKHLKIWNDRFTRNMIIVQWVVPLIAVSPVIYPFEFQIQLLADNKTVLLQWKDAKIAAYYQYFCTGAIGGPIFLIVLITYPIIFITAIVRTIRSKQPMGKAEKTALKMSMVGFVISFGLIIFAGTLYQRLISWNVFKTFWTDVPTFWMLYNVGNTIYAAANPYAMFIFSGAVRDRFVRMLFGSWLQEHGAGGA